MNCFPGHLWILTVTPAEDLVACFQDVVCKYALKTWKNNCSQVHLAGCNSLWAINFGLLLRTRETTFVCCVVSALAGSKTG